MYVELGNDRAIEGYRDPEDKLHFKEIEGQRTTRIDFPEGIGPVEAYSQIVDGIVPAHFQADAHPAWIETDSETLKALLDEKYGTQGVTKPTGWGDK